MYHFLHCDIKSCVWLVLKYFLEVLLLEMPGPADRVLYQHMVSVLNVTKEPRKEERLASPHHLC